MHSHYNVKMVEDNWNLHLLLAILTERGVFVLMFSHVAQWDILVEMVNPIILCRAWQIVKEHPIAIATGDEFGECLGLFLGKLILTELVAYSVTILIASLIVIDRNSMLEGHVVL